MASVVPEADLWGCSLRVSIAPIADPPSELDLAVGIGHSGGTSCASERAIRFGFGRLFDRPGPPARPRRRHSTVDAGWLLASVTFAAGAASRSATVEEFCKNASP